MKNLCLLILLYLASVKCQGSGEEHPDGPEIEGEINVFKAFVKEVQKRKGSGFQAMTHDDCSNNCLQKSSDRAVDNHFFKQMFSKRLRLNEFFNKTILYKACSKLNETVDCMKLCSESQAKAFYSQVLDPFKYMCLESDFVGYTTCYRQVFDESWTKCNGPEFCKEKKKQINAFLRNQPEEYTTEQLHSLMTHLCEYLSCYQDCQSEKMTNTCGERGAQVLNKFMRSIMKTVKVNLYDINPDGTPFPFQCNQVGNDL